MNSKQTQLRLVSFGVVFVAELMVHGLSVTIGHFLGVTLPECWPNWASRRVDRRHHRDRPGRRASHRAGALLHPQLPEHLLHGVASLLFALFGRWLLLDTALGWRTVAVVVTAVVAAAGLAALAVSHRNASPSKARGP
jgi:hypothetical protein